MSPCLTDTLTLSTGDKLSSHRWEKTALRGLRPGPKVIKLFSSSAQLSIKFQLLIDVEIVKISGKFMFKTQKLVIYPAHNVKMPTIVGILTFMSRINFSLN